MEWVRNNLTPGQAIRLSLLLSRTRSHNMHSGHSIIMAAMAAAHHWRKAAPFI